MKYRSPLLIVSLLALVIFAVLTLNTCKPDEKPPITETPSATKSVTVPKFERDSAFRYVEQQLSYGPRVVNTEGHRQAKEWMVQKFKDFGAKVTEQDFVATAYTGEKLNSTNIIAQYNPDLPNRVILAAHWDSRPFSDSPLYDGDINQPVMGADDGASGVAVLMEIARTLQANPLEGLGIDIVLFDAEDFGESGGSGNPNSYGLGSQHYARNMVGKHRPKYGILLDMVGAKDARFAIEQYSFEFAPDLVRKVWRLADQMGYSNYFVDADGGRITDDHYFFTTISQIPMIDIINRTTTTQTGFGAHWHTPDDTIEIIDRRTLRAVGQVLLATIYRDAGGAF